MADKTVQLIRTFAVVVGVIVTIMTCGVGLGRVQMNVSHIEAEAAKRALELRVVEVDVSNVKEKMSFLEGVVITKLDSQSDDIAEIKAKINELTRAD